MSFSCHHPIRNVRKADDLNKNRYIYNPHTYAELRDMTRGKIDPYLECISMRGQLQGGEEDGASMDTEQKRCDQIKPSVPALDQQQASAIAVLERCKSNYQQKQVIQCHAHTHMMSVRIVNDVGILPHTHSRTHIAAL